MARVWSMLGAAQRKRYSGHFGGEAAAQRAYESGASLSAARGHHKANLSTSNAPRATKAGTQDRVEHAITLMQDEGIGLSQAAKRAGVAPETVRRYGLEHQLISKEYDLEKRDKRGKSLFAGWGIHTITAPVLTSDGDFIEGVEFNGIQGRRTASYWYAVRDWSEHGDDSRLRAMGTYRVTARDGTVYTLETDPTALHRWWTGLTEKEQGDFHKQFGSETVLARRAA